MAAHYRDGGKRPSDELAELARAGRAAREGAIESADAQAKTEGERHLREALAAIHGAPKSMAVKTAAGVSLFFGTVFLLMQDSIPEPLGVVTITLGIGLAVLGGVMPTEASREAVERERAWAQRQPFVLDGYFAVLAAVPRPVGGIRIQITWKDPDFAIDEKLLHDALGVVDAAAGVAEVDRGTTSIVSGPLRGETGARINRKPVLKNHVYPEYVHRLVERVLVPLAKRHPIERVHLEPT